jgi:malonate-semialdehyde dehydrogenase (acetylating)/methylmalonate-semialdehyde dehydrogenase
VSVNQELPVLSHWINGTEALSSGDRTAPVFDPARGIETKRVALANAGDIEAAISSAHKAFPAWRDLSISRRQQIIFRFRELLNERKGELAQIITAEHGKVLRRTR